MTATSEPLLVRLEDAARSLGIGRTKIYELVASGQIETVTIGRCRRIAVADLHRYVDRLRADATPRP